MDLGSRHGTFADEQRLRPREWRCVFDGETISFGGCGVRGEASVFQDFPALAPTRTHLLALLAVQK